MNSTLARERLSQARALADPCRICPRCCGGRRFHGEVGYCGAGSQAKLFMEYVHWAEDADIVPAQTLYLTGCNLSCLFCQTAEEQRCLPATVLLPELFGKILSQGWQLGAKTVNILGGEPTVNLPALFELFAASGDFPSLVWNTNLYGNCEIFELLDGIADLFMADLKFGNAHCGAELAGAGNSAEIARARAEEIFNRSPERLIVRHLLMPGHFDCCTRPVLEWIARRLPGVKVSLKTVFMPPRLMPDSRPEKRFLTSAEVIGALCLAENLGLNLTKDAPPPVEEEIRAVSYAPAEQTEGVLMEAVITPDGRVYMRHVLREAAEVLEIVSQSLGDE